MTTERTNKFRSAVSWNSFNHYLESIMNKYSGYETHRPVEAPFAALIAPAHFVDEGILSALAEIRNSIVRALRDWHREFKISRTVAELSKLDDHVLYDIGVLRDEIHLAARSVVENPGADFRSGKARQG